jgi:Ricin-type beta-trefoil lectin domain-like
MPSGGATPAQSGVASSMPVTPAAVAKENRLLSNLSNLCLQTASGNPVPEKLVQGTCGAKSLTFVQTADPATGLLELRAKGTQLCVEITQGVAPERAEARLGACASAPHQRFSLLPETNGTFRIQSKSSGLCLNTFDSSLAPGATIIQWACGTFANQYFKTEGSAPITPEPPPSGNKCERFQPGNYVFTVDDPGRGIDGIAQIDNILQKDITNIRGVAIGIKWGSLEGARGAYYFSKLDAALNKVKAQGKYLLVDVTERSFHYDCGVPGVFPSYVATEAGPPGIGTKCTAKIWEPAVMDGFIALHQAIANRYKNDLHFLGFRPGEAQVSAPTFRNGNRQEFDTLMKPQLLRYYREVHGSAPTMFIGNALNWLTRAQGNEFADALERLGSGGMINWPDTVASENTIGNYQATDGYAVLNGANNNEFGWYNLARQRRNRMVIMPDVQTPMVKGTLEAHDEIYRFLRDDIGAHMVIWSDYHSDQFSDYLSQMVIPTVNKYSGRLNSTCPY